MSNSETKGKNSRLALFWKGIKAEFKKIIWPERDTLIKQLAAVLVVTVLTGVLIAVVDFGFNNLIDFLIKLKF